MKQKISQLIAILITTISVNAQEPVVQETLEKLLEAVGENITEDTDILEFQEDLEKYKRFPLNINTATVEELMKLHILNELQANQIVLYRKKTGAILSLYEMTAIDGINQNILQKIEPFICFAAPVSPITEEKNTNLLFIKTTRSFSNASTTESKNEGSMERLYLRYKHSQKNCQYGFVAEKDPGEAFFKKSNKHGFDYNSVFANFRIGNNGSRLFIGDYHVRFGLGLVAWQGFSIGKSAETTQVFRSNQGIKSYNSTDENQFFRGVAGLIRKRNITISPFLSFHKLDANIDTVDNSKHFQAFQTSGYHRFGSELTGENTLNEFSGGGNIEYSFNQWIMGITTIFNHFNIALDRNNEPYNLFLPEGKNHLVSGIHWKRTLKNTLSFGEIAFCKNNGKAFITGIMTKPAPNVELSLIYRNINKSYFSYYSNAFSESSKTNDEKAFYLGIKVSPVSQWTIWGYADLFKHNWIKYTTSGPSNGTEFLVQMAYQPSKEKTYTLRYFQEDKDQRAISKNSKYNEIQTIKRLRFDYLLILNRQINLKSRLEYINYSKENTENGYLAYQDFNFKPLHNHFSLNLHLVCFKTDGYDSRLYAFENDVLYSFSIPALYGEGFRECINFQHQINEKFTVWFKISSTQQRTQKTEIQTNNTSIKSEIKVQIRYQF